VPVARRIEIAAGLDQRELEIVDRARRALEQAALDELALARAVLEFFAAGGRTAYAAGVRETAKRYSWERLAAAVLELGTEARQRKGGST